jgi:hypothetical protein
MRRQLATSGPPSSKVPPSASSRVSHDRIRDIADINRLEAGIDDRQHGREFRHAGEHVEQTVLGAEDNRRAQDDGAGERRAHGGLALRFALAVFGGRGIGGAQRRHMNQARHTCHGRGLGDIARTLRMDALEAATAAAFGEDADKIDDPVRARNRTRDRRLVCNIGRNRDDVADAAHDLQEQRLVWAAHRDADRVALFGQAPHQVTPDEARTAEYGHQFAGNTRHVTHPLAMASLCAQVAFTVKSVRARSQTGN